MIVHCRSVEYDPNLPALRPGDEFDIVLSPTGSAVILPVTPENMGRLAGALNRGTVVTETEPAPLNEVLAYIEVRAVEMAENPRPPKYPERLIA